MGYGTPKIQNADIKKAILASVEDALNKQADVFQGSQAYYGYSARVEINLRLIARGDSSVKVNALAGEGEIPGPVKGGTEPAPVDKALQIKTELTQGKQAIAKTGE